MRVADLKDYAYDKVVIYRENNTSDIETSYTDIYKGFIQSAPTGIQNLKIKTIGAKKAGILDIRVE